MEGAAEQSTWPSDYRRAVAFYLRDDVSEALCSLARRRPLHFYYHTDRDYRLREASRTRVTLHCPRDARSFRAAIRSAASGVTECGSPFYPFFTMTNRANVPGAPDSIVGWDLCLEYDLGIVESFRALTPVLGVLEHFGVRHLAKFSGHRSLHVIIPAEALSAAVGTSSPTDWARAHERLGRLLCRLVPGLSATAVGIAKRQPLSAPYSLHRYRGLVGLPVSLDEALAFDPSSAEVDRFPGVSWRPEDWSGEGGGSRLLDLSDEVEADPFRALTVAAEVFAGERWREYLAAGSPIPDCIERSIFAGPVGLGHLSEGICSDERLAARVGRAIVALDSPDVKTMRFHRLFAPAAYHVLALAGRAEASRVLAFWARDGYEAALALLLSALSSDEGTREHGILATVRLLSLLPEAAGSSLGALASRWQLQRGAPDAQAVFLALAIGELAPRAADASRLLAPGDREGSARDEIDRRRVTWRILIADGGIWRAEIDPVRALAALGLAFGEETLAAWLARPDEVGRLMLVGVFGNDRAKLAHAARQLLGHSG